MRITAPAKLNLFLHIIDRRHDGYHCIESVFVFTKWGDAITITPNDQSHQSPQLTLTMDGPFYESIQHEPIEQNLAYKAATLLQKTYAISTGVHIHITKNIPVGAGLGGGSSDAAAVLILLNQFWKLQLDSVTLCNLGLTLGADVPACILRQPAFVTGIGEIIDPFSLPFPLPVLLVNPHIVMPTKSVFQTYQDRHTPFSSPINQVPHQATQSWPALKQFLNQTRNDLENPATTLAPSIADLIKLIEQQHGCQLARMSGSGATCFGLFLTQDECHLAAKTIQQMHPSFWVQETLIQCST